MNSAGDNSLRALVLAPAGRTAPRTALTLRDAGFAADICPDLESLTAELMLGAGLVIVAETAVMTADLRPLLGFLESQPPWSDIPFIVLARRGHGTRSSPASLPLRKVLGNVTFLAEPFHPASLSGLVHGAVRSRRRQYDAAARESALEHRLQAQTLESVGQLTGGIAHDFNNLLMAVMGNLEILRKRLPDEPGLRRLIEGAIQGAKRGSSLTQRLLAFARQQDLRTLSADIGALLNGMRELLVRSLGPDITLRLHIAAELPPAEVDAHQLELAILNLAMNARDAMPGGGVIEIRVDQRHGGSADRLRPGNYVRVQIADNGTGMDTATLGKAIEPFFSTKPLGKGTGLGLSMTHGLAEQLGGHLDLASEVGVGTVATLWLPMADAPAAATAAPMAAAGANRRATILVVDDDPLIATSTVDMLEDLGHRAIEANSGQRALEIIDGREDIDLVVTDQAMPGMTGIQLAEIVRSKRPHLPVLLATGYTDLSAGKLANLPRLSKPYEQAQLQAQIAKLIPVL